jgi:hypothetical protein
MANLMQFAEREIRVVPPERRSLWGQFCAYLCQPSDAEQPPSFELLSFMNDEAIPTLIQNGQWGAFNKKKQQLLNPPVAAAHQTAATAVPEHPVRRSGKQEAQD